MKCPSCSAELVVTTADLGASARSARMMVDVAHPDPVCDGFDAGAVVKSILVSQPTPTMSLNVTKSAAPKGDAAG